MNELLTSTYQRKESGRRNLSEQYDPWVINMSLSS